MKVKNFYNKNQFLIESEDLIELQSYESLVASINKKTGVLKLGVDWDYSNTTMKHLYLFIADYRHYLKKDICELFIYFYREKNKRKYIQKLIDNKKIEYDENMK